MHISQIAKVLTGQRKKAYESLDGHFTFTVSPVSEVYFNITSLIGNTLFINWDDENNPNEEEIATTGVSQRISHTYSSSDRERTIRIHGSGVYVMSIFNVSGFRNIKDFPFNSENCSILHNLKQLLLADSDYFHWDENCDWSLLPKINVIDLQSCNNLSGFSTIDPNVSDNYPAALSTLILSDTTLSSLTIKNYPHLRNISISGINELKYCDLEGCTNLKDIYLNNNIGLTSANFKNCSSMLSSYMYRVLDLNNVSFEGCTSMLSATFRTMNTKKTTEDFEINWSGCDSLKNIRLDEVYCKNVLPTPEETPNLEILSAKMISGGISGDIDLNGYNSLKSISFNAVFGLKNISCIGNRTLTSGYFGRCDDLERASFENCTKLSGISFAGDSTHNSLEYMKIRNCPSLRSIKTSENNLYYGCDITQCDNLSDVNMYHTNLKSFYLSGLPNLQNLYLEGKNENSSLSKVEIDNCERLNNVVLYKNYHSLNEVKISNCPKNDLKFNLTYCYGINKVTLNALGTQTSKMNDLLSQIKEYSLNNAGEINIINCTYLPSGNYITDLTNNGWTYNVSYI